jgi:hypothetical protein
MLDAVDDGFDLVTMTGIGMNPTKGQRAHLVALHSADGHDWTTIDGLGGAADWITAIGRLNGRMAIVTGGSNAALLLANGNGTWATTHIHDLLAAETPGSSNTDVYSAGIGPLGVVIAVGVSTDPVAKAGGVSVRSGDYTYHLLTQDGRSTVTDAAGKVVASTSSVDDPNASSQLVRGAEGDIELRDESGNVLAAFSWSDVKDELGRIYGDGEPTRFRILTSREGEVWANDDASALADATVSSITRVTVDGERAIVAGTLARNGTATGPLPAVALVATPR